MAPGSSIGSMMLVHQFSTVPSTSPQQEGFEEVLRRFLEAQRTTHHIPREEVVLKMVNVASSYIPKDNPNKPRGEDAHFVSVERQTIGLADGVGGWIKEGIDSGEYARQLMMNSVLALHQEPAECNVNPKRILQEAFKNTTANGSSTACIVTLCGNRLLAANVGDSGFLVIRNGRVIYRSSTQQRRFNCPYQLGNNRDDPTMALDIEFFVQSGDVVVAGTDGLLDNLHVFEIEEVLRLKTIEGDGVEEISCYMANLALYNSFDKYAETPYSIAAKEAGICRKGGKVDDITVIVARIES